MARRAANLTPETAESAAEKKLRQYETARRGRAGWKAKAAGQRKLIRQLAKELAKQQKGHAQRLAREHLDRLLGLSTQHVEDVLTGEVLVQFDLTDERYIELKSRMAELVMDRGGVPKRSENSMSIEGGGPPVLVRIEGGLGWPQSGAGEGGGAGGGRDARGGGAGTR